MGRQGPDKAQTRHDQGPGRATAMAKAQAKPRQGPIRAQAGPKQGQGQTKPRPRPSLDQERPKQVPDKAQRLGKARSSPRHSRTFGLSLGLVWVWPCLGPAWDLPGPCLGIVWAQREFQTKFIQLLKILIIFSSWNSSAYYHY